jgi:hypothetical protein
LKESKNVRENMTDQIDLRSKLIQNVSELQTTFNPENLEGIECETEECFLDELEGVKASNNQSLIRAVLNFQNRTGYKNYLLYSEDNQSIINWSDYTIRFDFSTQRLESELAMIYSNVYAFLVSEEQDKVYFFLNTDQGVKVLEKDFRLVKGVQHRVFMNYTGGKGILSIDDEQVIQINIPGGPGELSFIKKSFNVLIENILVQNLYKECFRRDYYGKCAKSYTVYRQPTSRSRGQLASVTTTTAPELDRIDYEFFEQRNIPINRYIPDQKLSFQAKQSEVKNVQDYELEFKFATLDGARIIRLIFDDYNQSKYIFEVSEHRDQLSLTHFDNKTGKAVRYYKDVQINETEWHKVKLAYKDKTVSFYFDNHFMFDLPYDFGTGYYELESKNTFVHFADFAIRNHETGQTKRITLQADPCQLRKVGEEILGNGTITLQPGQNKTMNYAFVAGSNLDRFDYGLVSFSLPENQLEVHFWVSRK